MPELHILQEAVLQPDTFDIICIHGLGGDHRKTWTNREANTFWIKDYLGKDLPHARIMNFDYDCSLISGSISQNILTIAQQLQGFLGPKRRTCKDRTLIFLGHSLGGLIAKQLVIISKNNKQYKEIYEATSGFIFFGTPHRGSEKAHLAALLNRVVRTCLGKPNNDVVEELKTGSSRLEDITEHFRHMQDRWLIANLHEQKPMSGASTMIVPRDSATMGVQNEWVIPVDANHSDMCKLPSRNSLYEQILDHVKEISQHSVPQDAPQARKVKRQVVCSPRRGLNSNYLPPPGLGEKLKTASQPEAQYRSEARPKRFLIYGIGGSGKTQSCLNFFNTSKKAFHNRIWVDASSQSTLEQGLGDVAKKAGCPIESSETAIEWLGNRISNKERWLLVLDGFAFEEMHLEDYPLTQGNGFVLISAQRMPADGDEFDEKHEMEPLPETEARKLLFQVSKASEKSTQEMQAASKLVEHLERLPLAVTLAGAHIHHFPAMSISRYLKIWETKILGEYPDAIQGDSRRSLNTTFRLTFEAIESLRSEDAKSARNLLRAFSFFHYESIQVQIFRNTWAYLSQGGRRQQHQMWISNSVSDTEWDAEKEEERFFGALGFLKKYCLLTLDNGSADTGYSVDGKLDEEKREDTDDRTNIILSVHSLVAKFARHSMPVDQQTVWFNKAANIIAANIQAKTHTSDIFTHLSHIYVNQPQPDDLIRTPCFFSKEKLRIPILLADFHSKNGHIERARDIRFRICKSLDPAIAPQLYIQQSLVLASSYQDLRQYQEAYDVRLKALNIAKHRAGSGVRQDTRLYFDTMLDMSKSKRCLKPPNEAIEYCRQVRRIFNREFPRDQRHGSIKDWNIYYFLPLKLVEGASLLDMRRFEEAKLILESAKSDFSVYYGNDSTNHELLTCRSYLAVAYSGMGDHRKALGERKEIFRRRREDNNQHPDTLSAKEDIAASLSRLGKYEEARELREAVFEEWGDLLRTGQIRQDYSQYLTAKMNLAHDLKDSGQPGAALKHYEEIYASQKEAAKAQHRGHCSANCNLTGNVLFCETTHRFYDASEALEAQEHVMFAHFYAKDSNEFEKAKNILVRIWETLLKSNNSDSNLRDYLSFRNELATTLDTDEQKIAERKRILERQVQKFRREDLFTLQTISSLIMNYDNLGDSGSVYTHGQVLEQHRDITSRQPPKDLESALKAFAKVKSANQEMTPYEHQALILRSERVPTDPASSPMRAVPGRLPPGLPLRQAALYPNIHPFHGFRSFR